MIHREQMAYSDSYSYTSFFHIQGKDCRSQLSFCMVKKTHPCKACHLGPTRAPPPALVAAGNLPFPKICLVFVSCTCTFCFETIFWPEWKLASECWQDDRARAQRGTSAVWSASPIQTPVSKWTALGAFCAILILPFLFSQFVRHSRAIRQDCT